MNNAARFATRLGTPLLAMTLGLTLHAQQYGQPSSQNGPPPQGQYGQQQGPPQGQGYGQGNGQGYGQGNGQGYGRDQGPGWDAPPNEFSEIGRRGFHDGLEAARFDFGQHRPMAFQRNQQYRHPPTPGRFRDDYRNGFQRGYERAANRMMQRQGPPPPPPGQGYGHPR